MAVAPASPRSRSEKRQGLN